MNLSETKSLAKPFSHIYVEDDALNYLSPERFLEGLQAATLLN